MSFGWAWVVAMGLGQIAAPTPGDPIIGGELVPEGAYEEVVAVHVPGNICSGTRVAPGLVLTAAHCLALASTPGDVAISTGTNAYEGVPVPALAYGIHPEFCLCREDRFDYGWVQVLPGSLGIDALAVPITDQAEWDALVGPGRDVTLVGYGADPGTGDGPRHKREVTVPISDATASGQEFSAGGSFRDSCGGDSGGPAFVVLPDGTRRQVGITSRGSDPCGQGGQYATVYPALAWVYAETGVNLCGDQCGACDCLDVAPAADDDGACACRSGARPDALGVLLVVLGLGLGRLVRPRRRAHEDLDEVFLG